MTLNGERRLVKRIGAEDRGPPNLTFPFHHDVHAPKHVRDVLLRRLLTDAADPILDPVILVASELITNVVLHTPFGGELRAWDPKPDVPFRLEVIDHDPTPPESPARASEHGGQGLRIVQRLSNAWGVDMWGAGKTVWAEFDRYSDRFR
jgi:hypothetical protein